MNNSIDLVASPFSSNSDSIEELSGKPNAPTGAAAAARGRAQSQSGKLIDPAIAVANKGIEELNRIDEVRSLTPFELSPDDTYSQPF